MTDKEPTPTFHGKKVFISPSRPEMLTSSGHILWFHDGTIFMAQPMPLTEPRLIIGRVDPPSTLGEVYISAAPRRFVYKPAKFLSLHYRRVAEDVLGVMVNAHKNGVRMRMRDPETGEVEEFERKASLLPDPDTASA